LDFIVRPLSPAATCAVPTLLTPRLQGKLDPAHIDWRKIPLNGTAFDTETFIGYKRMFNDKERWCVRRPPPPRAAPHSRPAFQVR